MSAINPPPGMAAVLLYVPAGEILNKSPIDIQADLGLPWQAEGGSPHLVSFAASLPNTEAGHELAIVLPLVGELPTRATRSRERPPRCLYRGAKKPLAVSRLEW